METLVGAFNKKKVLVGALYIVTLQSSRIFVSSSTTWGHTTLYEAVPANSFHSTSGFKWHLLIRLLGTCTHIVKPIGPLIPILHVPRVPSHV